MKILLIIIDGLGDRPIRELGNRTPLEAAKTPNLDWLAEQGVCGLVEPSHHTAIPTSEEGHFSLFGYNPKKYPIRRGIFTALGAGMKMKPGDVALRGNFGTVDDKLNMIDRRAGRINKTQPLINALNGMVIEGVYPVKSRKAGAAKPLFNRVKFLIQTAGGHRIGIILHGKNLSSQISDGDPHYGKLGREVQKIVPLDKTKEAKFTARVLNVFLEKAHQILKNHPINKQRKRAGLPPANYILTRGASSLIKLPSFEKKYGLRACCIAGKILYKQIGKMLGMDLIKVRGADGSPTTNLRGKFLAAKRALKKYNFVFLHIKAADSLAEDGDFIGKRDFIEKIDKNLKPISGLKNNLIIVTADHSTCSGLKRHCVEPIPILVFGKRKDLVDKFSEKACRKGKLGKIKQIYLMPKILKLAEVDIKL